MNKNNLGRSVILAIVLVVFVVSAGVFLYSCASEKQRAAVRAAASPAAGPTDTAGKVRAAAYGAVPTPGKTISAKDFEEGVGQSTTPTTFVFVTPTPSETPKDKNLLSLKDRLKIPLVQVALKYERFNVDQAVLSYRLTEKQEKLQQKGFANREATAKKLLDLKEKFLEETGLLAEEAAALFPQVPARGKK